MSELRPIRGADVREGDDLWPRPLQSGIVGVLRGATGAGEGQSEETRQRSGQTGEGA